MLNKLLLSLYSAADGSGDWHQFLSDWTTATNGGCAAFFTQNFDDDSVGAFVSHQIDPEVFQAYSEYYSGINVFMENEDLLPSGSAVVGQHLYPDDKLVKSEFYNDWMQPNNMYHTMGGVILRDGAWCSKISILRSKLAGCYTDKEFELACEIMPHMYRAVKTFNTLGAIGTLHTASLEILEYLPLAALAVDSNGQVIFTNRRADEILSRMDGLRIDKDSHITALKKQDAQALKMLIGKTTEFENLADTRSSNTLLISRVDTSVRYEVQVSPLRADEYKWQINPPRALILISDALESSSPTNHKLVDAYGLTPTEARVVELVVNGFAVKHIATTLGIAELTVRQHLKGVFRKTGARSQADLVRIILTSTLVFSQNSNPRSAL